MEYSACVKYSEKTGEDTTDAGSVAVVNNLIDTSVMQTKTVETTSFQQTCQQSVQHSSQQQVQSVQQQQQQQQQQEQQSIITETQEVKSLERETQEVKKPINGMRSPFLS